MESVIYRALESAASPDNYPPRFATYLDYNYCTGRLRKAILLLIEGSPLLARFKDHPLAGDWKHFRHCHIGPDWLLIYKIDDYDLHLVRTGTHSDLF